MAGKPLRFVCIVAIYFQIKIHHSGALKCLSCLYPSQSRPDDTSCLDPDDELSVMCPTEATYCSKTELKSPDGKTSVTRMCVEENQILQQYRDRLNFCVDEIGKMARMCTCKTDNCNSAFDASCHWSTYELLAISLFVMVWSWFGNYL